MTFLWPAMLLTLLVIPVMVALYVRAQRRRRVLLASFYNQGDGQKDSAQPRGFRRHLPSVFFLLGLVLMLVALARPQAQVSLPRVEGTVMLVFDVSASMGANDAQPSRLEAAKATAHEFVLSQPATVRIGVVAFSDSGFTVQQPTNDTVDLASTINRLKPASATSLGQGIISALQTVAVDGGLARAEPTPTSTPSSRQGGGANPQPTKPSARDLLAQLPEGTYPAAVIVLLSDGENTQSIDPIEAAIGAAERGVRVDALGFGTAAGATLTVDGYRVHTALDEGALRQITRVAGGTYYPVEGEQDPKQVYASLVPRMVVRPETMEITSVLAGASIVLLLIGSLFSIVWFTRLP